MRGFLELTGYYKRFIKDYGRLAQPLTALLKKDQVTEFCWTKDAQAAFHQLQLAITSAPVLAAPDFTKAIMIECDASRTGVEAMLMQ